MYDGDLPGIIALCIPILAIISSSIIAISSIVSKNKLKIEQIKADAMIRAEEIRAKNQLEIEKLLISEHRGNAQGRVNPVRSEPYDESMLERSNKEKLRT